MTYSIRTGAPKTIGKSVWVGLLLISLIFIACLFAIKTRALKAKARVKHLEHVLERERAEVRLMNAELAHLLNPERLERLAETYLELHPTKAKQTLGLSVAMDKIPIIETRMDDEEGK